MNDSCDASEAMGGVLQGIHHSRQDELVSLGILGEAPRHPRLICLLELNYLGNQRVKRSLCGTKKT